MFGQISSVAFIVQAEMSLCNTMAREIVQGEQMGTLHFYFTPTARHFDF